jgi:hypothetical protein
MRIYAHSPVLNAPVGEERGRRFNRRTPAYQTHHSRPADLTPVSRLHERVNGRKRFLLGSIASLLISPSNRQVAITWSCVRAVTRHRQREMAWRGSRQMMRQHTR